MIVINQNEDNTAILELTSVSSLISPYYLFEFINDFNPQNITYLTANDLSNFKCRYNRFIIKENIVNDNINGQVSLISGNYTYNVYESLTQTLNKADTTGKIITTGKLLVIGLDSTIPAVYR